MKNGEITYLQKIVLVIIILSAIIGPWLYHDRLIVRMDEKLTYIQKKVDNIEKLLNPTQSTSSQASTQFLLPPSDKRTKPSRVGL